MTEREFKLQTPIEKPYIIKPRPVYTDTTLEPTPKLNLKGADWAVSCLLRPSTNPVSVPLCHPPVHIPQVCLLQWMYLSKKYTYIS